jgi:hypothetical protein
LFKNLKKKTVYLRAICTIYKRNKRIQTMKITKRQLRKIIEEEIKKVYEIGSSGRSAWDPTNAKEREKEVYRLGKDKIARLRAAAKEDQEDRAKSPRFGKPAKEDPTQLKETTGDPYEWIVDRIADELGI